MSRSDCPPIDADALIDVFRPGTLERMGFAVDPAATRAIEIHERDWRTDQGETFQSRDILPAVSHTKRTIT